MRFIHSPIQIFFFFFLLILWPGQSKGAAMVNPNLFSWLFLLVLPTYIYLNKSKLWKLCFSFVFCLFGCFFLGGETHLNLLTRLLNLYSSTLVGTPVHLLKTDVWCVRRCLSAHHGCKESLFLSAQSSLIILLWSLWSQSFLPLTLRSPDVFSFSHRSS